MVPNPSNRRWECRAVRLTLRHPWTTAQSTSEYRDTIHVRLTSEGVTGVGEGAPIARYQETAEEGCRMIESLRPFLEGSDPWRHEKLLAEISERVPGQFAAKASIDVALFDWVGRKLGVPLYRLFGLDPDSAPSTSLSIGIDDPGATRQKVLEAEPFPTLKLKMGLRSDEATLAAVRSVTQKPLRVDANEGWRDKETALRKLRWLEKQRVELVEQPMPASMLEETRWLRRRVQIPIFADEAATSPVALPALVGAYDGVNIKLDKCGGIQPALRMIHTARALGLKVMLGCMVSSSVSITAAAHLSPLVDYADLDGNLLISNDPYRGVTVRSGKLVLPPGPGLGVMPVGVS